MRSIMKGTRVPARESTIVPEKRGGPGGPPLLVGVFWDPDGTRPSPSGHPAQGVMLRLIVGR